MLAISATLRELRKSLRPRESVPDKVRRDDTEAVRHAGRPKQAENLGRHAVGSV